MCRTSSSRSRRASTGSGRAHVLYVMETAPYTRYPATDDLDARIEWVGPDDRDVELEVIAVELPTAHPDLGQ